MEIRLMNHINNRYRNKQIILENPDITLNQEFKIKSR